MRYYYIELERFNLWRDYSIMAHSRNDAVEYAAREYYKENGMKPKLLLVACDDYTIER